MINVGPTARKFTIRITKNTVILKTELRRDLHEMHHPHVRHRRTAENAGADPMGKLAKTRKCRSLSHGLRE